MARMKKATRKYEKNHLKDTIDRRKDVAKIKQRNQIKDKKRAKRAKENGDAEDDQDGEVKKGPSNGEDAFGDMTVDDFFEGGFEIPEDPQAKKSVKAKKAEKGSKTSAKRKRSDVDEQQGDDGSSVSLLEHTAAPSDSGSGSESGEDLGTHKGELDALAEKDPEFYKHLKDNDPELLNFGDLAEVDQLSGSDGEDTVPKKKRKKAKKEAAPQDLQEEADFEEKDDDTEVTVAMVQKWRAALVDVHSLRAMRQVVLAFRAAVHVNEEDGIAYKYAISSPDVYHDLLLLTLQEVPRVLNHHLPVKESGSGKLRVSTDSKKFRTLTPLLKSHSSSVNHLLTTLSDAPTLKVALESLTSLLPYLLSFKKLLRNLIKTVVGIWSDGSSAEATRVVAFLAIRRLAVVGDSGIREAVLKTAYQGLVKGSRNTTIHTLQGINLMKNSAAELWGLDQTVGYTTGFTFVRQLAIHLRGSITNPTKESYKTVYNWQYVHSLDFWSRVLSMHCDAFEEASAGAESALRPLIYPTVQITLGALRLIPTSTYFPLRFQLTRSLLRISRASGTYIPLAPALLEVLHSAEMKKPPKPSTLKPLDFSTSIRAPKAYLRTRVYQDGVGEQVGELFGEFFALWTKSVAFPELCLPITVALKRWLKDTSPSSQARSNGKRPSNKGNKNSKLSSALHLLTQKLSANASFIEQRRATLDFAPDNRAAVAAFLAELPWQGTPLGAFVEGQRAVRAEKARLVEAGRREEARKRGQGEDGNEGDGDGDEGMAEGASEEEASDEE
ncbi:MAG: Nucleolar Complex 2 protein [Thelocarpon impressellum]|nr:MAG: Nucleolar Complex 2 protein [Thelocarpon impressellum]